MSTQPAAKPTKRPPYFYTEVEVDISPLELERAGWRYVGDEETAAVSHTSAVDVIRRWHEDHHPAAWQFCDHELCDRIRRMLIPAGES